MRSNPLFRDDETTVPPWGYQPPKAETKTVWTGKQYIIGADFADGSDMTVITMSNNGVTLKETRIAGQSQWHLITTLLGQAHCYYASNKRDAYRHFEILQQVKKADEAQKAARRKKACLDIYNFMTDATPNIKGAKQATEAELDAIAKRQRTISGYDGCI